MGLENDEKQAIELELNVRLENVKSWLIQQRYTKDQLICLCASQIIMESEYRDSRKELHEIIDAYETMIKSSLEELKCCSVEATMLIDCIRDFPKKQAKLIYRASAIAIRNQHVSAARHAADSRHKKPGGSRYKQEKIREIWACGKYSSRDICAEQECAVLNMSFSTARKALRNTPDRA